MLNANLYAADSSSALSDSSESPSLPVLSDGEATSPGSEVGVLSYEEIEALRQYSHSIQIFTYQLFEKFRLQVEAKAALAEGRSNSGSEPESSGITNISGPKNSAEFHSQIVGVPKTEEEMVASGKIGTRKPSDLPRRKMRPTRFPSDTGL